MCIDELIGEYLVRFWLSIWTEIDYGTRRLFYDTIENDVMKLFQADIPSIWILIRASTSDGTQLCRLYTSKVVCGCRAFTSIGSRLPNQEGGTLRQRQKCGEEGPHFR